MKPTVGHFGGLSNVAVALETQRGSSESIWLQPGKVREVKVDLVSGSRMESKNVLYLCHSCATGMITQESKALVERGY